MQPGPPYPYAPPAPPPKKSRSTCLVVSIVVAAIFGLLLLILVPMAIYGVRRYLAASKTAEAKNTIGAIARVASAAYERERTDSELVVGAGGEGAHALCRSAIPVPAFVPRGSKYQPSGVGADFDTGDASAGWKCLKFEMAHPIYYQYHYQQGYGYVSPAAPGPDGFEAVAKGDLDGDGSHSTFALSGQVTGGRVKIVPQLHIVDEFE